MAVVRIKESPETIAIGLANSEGTCYGQAILSASCVDMIGVSASDYAINVNVDGKGQFWLADHLVERVRHEPGTIGIGGKKFVSDHNAK